MNKLFASISLDLDNQWSYMKTHGDPAWEDYPSYLDIFIPHVLEILARNNIKITFFVVGLDAVQEKNKPLLKLLVEHGHEIGNHSFRHEVWPHMYTRDELQNDISGAEESIIQATGKKPIGYRGPGFTWTADLLEILAQKGYVYDASTLPTFLGPLARAYYFWTSELTQEEKEQRKGIYGTFRDGFKPVKPYQWLLPSGNTLLEIPVTTIPIAKIPFHLSYLIYLCGFSKTLMLSYLKSALMLCKLTRTEPSFLLHPLDLISGEQIPELSFFPGMNVPVTEKVNIFETVLKELSQNFQLGNMSAHANTILAGNSVACKAIPREKK